MDQILTVRGAGAHHALGVFMRIIDGFAKKVAEQFFERFQNAIEAPDPTEVAECHIPEGDMAAS